MWKWVERLRGGSRQASVASTFVDVRGQVVRRIPGVLHEDMGDVHGDSVGLPPLKPAADPTREEGIRGPGRVAMRSPTAMTITFALLLPITAHAGASEFDTSIRARYAMKAEWFSCKSDADCTLVGVGCGPSLSVASSHKADAAAAIEKKDGKFMGCDGSSPDWSVPVCDMLQCMTVTDRVRAEALRKQPDVEFKVEKLEAVPVPNPPASSDQREQLKALPPPNAGQRP
jgi:hypothetical protein